MQTLTPNEIQFVSGARIRPSDWLWPAAFGALTGVGTFVVTAFSATPVGFVTSIGTGFLIGGSLGAAHDFLREYDL
ncbi:hypothetical protein [Candidatus Berkiella aquae]|uniref:Uncharacterized protein n=1 Tax=Candidatus Berkiella aquae TaxID=295108 RepID=A0A0Q9YPH1_9GAMM|nr:hypothetical protein [Candidatus Berkiella aquae]MCS5711935.1 hypothetical protein [Candidatus Berkiella aquae]